MTFEEMSLSRQSTRTYDATKVVDYENLVKICEIARNAPSSCNSQPWKFHIVTDKSIDIDIEEVRKACQLNSLNKWLADVNNLIIIEQVPGNASSKAGATLTRNDYNSMDIGMVADHICFAALELGLSTCMIGAFLNPVLCKAMRFKKSQRIRLVIAVGYPKDNTPIRKKSRKLVDDLIIKH